VQRFIRPCAALMVVALVSCKRGPKTSDSGPVDQRPFSAFATQQIIVTPTAHVRAGDSLGWVQGMGGTRQVARQMDSSLATVLNNRGLASKWVLPAALQRSFERNRSYAADPYQLGIQPLRVSSFVSGSKYGEPLSSQLRTMIALESEARFVLVPVELRFEKEDTRMRAVLRLVFLDPRLAEAKWVGEVKGALVADPALALAIVANLVADLFVAP
jgi:hypothetical protein